MDRNADLFLDAPLRPPSGEGKSVANQLQKLVEGRRPNLHVAAKIAEATGEQAAYIRNRAFDKEHYKQMILKYLGRFGSAAREDLDKLLLDKLSDTLSPTQRKTFVTNLLQEMRRDGLVQPAGTSRWAKWALPNSTTQN